MDFCENKPMRDKLRSLKEGIYDSRTSFSSSYLTTDCLLG